MRSLKWFLGTGLVLLGLKLAFAQTSPRHYLSSITSNPTLVVATRAILAYVVGTNTNATTYYLKIYDKATTPVCGTDTPVITLPLAQNVPNKVNTPMTFDNGVGFCITGAIGDSDASGAAAGIAIDISVSGR